MRQDTCPSCGQVSQLASIEHGPVTSDLHIVFIHGWLDNAASFESVMGQIELVLPAAALHAMDLPGHGLSPHKSVDNFYGFHDYLFDVHQFISDIPCDQVVLVGHSLGGLIASCYAAAFPEKVRALLQIEGVGPLYEEAQLCVERMRKGIISRSHIVNKPIKSYASYTDALLHKATRCAISESLIKPIVDRGIVNQNGSWYWRADIRLHNRSLYRMTQSQATQIISSISCPYRVLLGTEGYPDIKQQMSIMLPERAQYAKIPGGHYCHLESVDAVVSHLVSLLREESKAAVPVLS